MKSSVTYSALVSHKFVAACLHISHESSLHGYIFFYTFCGEYVFISCAIIVIKRLIVDKS